MTENETLNDVKEMDETQADEMEAGDETAPEGMEDMEQLLAMYENSLKQFAEGEVVVGKIVAMDRDYVLVDIGYKSEGQIRTSEFKNEKGELDINVGDDVEVMIEYWDEENETLVLSKEKAVKVKVWEAIKETYDNDGVIDGVIVSRVKGGFSVDVGLQAFLPGSQADLRPIRNFDEMVGQTYQFKILKYSRRRNNIVLSRRVLVEADLEAKRTEVLANIAEGQVVEGIVKNITEYGVFVDLGGVDGLLHITDISWGRVRHPAEMFSIGDNITLKVLSFDLDKKKISLGMKQLTPDPWTLVSDTYPVGTRVTGKVVSITNYGIFIELQEGVEGLIHVSEISWTRKIRHPSRVVNVGEEVEAVVLDLQPENRRISLGMKQVEPNPWEVISEKYPVGTVIEGRIKNITDFGLFIGIDDDIDGLVHISDISWTRRIKHPSEVYKKGDVVQAVVLEIDKNNERFSMGIKQLGEDPWESVKVRYPLGTKISGIVTNVTDFGIFVELEEGIEGLVHVSEVSTERIKTPVGQYEVGDELTARVMNVNVEERKIGLSIKRLETDDDKSLLQDYMDHSKPATSAFGELLRENLQDELKNEQSAREDQAGTESAAASSAEAPEEVDSPADEEESGQESPEQENPEEDASGEDASEEENPDEEDRAD
ncbi:MAG: 30S ribosomal protein S1 [Desulfosudaceae bacterium]